MGKQPQLQLSIKHKGGTENTSINMETNKGDWAYAGAYTFEKGQSNYIKVNGSATSTPAVADAILLVPQK